MTQLLESHDETTGVCLQRQDPKSAGHLNKVKGCLLALLEPLQMDSNKKKWELKVQKLKRSDDWLTHSPQFESLNAIGSVVMELSSEIDGLPIFDFFLCLTEMDGFLNQSNDFAGWNWQSCDCKI